MGDQDLNLYRQLYSQLGRKLGYGTTLPSPTAEPMTVPFIPQSSRKAVAKEEIAVSELVRDDGFQFLYPFHDWWWPDPPEGYIDPNAYVLLSRMPVSQWNATGLMTKYEISSKDLYSTYRNVLLNCPKIEVYSSRSLHGAREDWNTQYSKALTDSEKPSSPSDEKPGFVKMSTNLGTMVLENYIVGHGDDWISELKKKAEEGNTSGDDEPLLDLSLDLPTAFSSDFPTTFLSDSPTTFTSDLPTAMSLDIPQPHSPFFATLMSNNEWEKFDLAHHDKKASVSVKVGAVARVPVDPDPKWYDSKYLHTLAKRNSWNPPFTTADIFGEQGLLSQRITGFIAAYRITFKITVSPMTFRTFKPTFDAAVGFRIGPFEFGEGVRVHHTLADVSGLILGLSSSKAVVSSSVSGSIPELSSSISGAPLNQPRLTAGWKRRAHSETSTFEGESTAEYPIIIGINVEKIVCEL